MLPLYSLSWLSTVSLLTNVAATPLKSQLTIDLGYAKYQGTALNSGVNQYLGMRFAAPPIGELRFRAARPPLKTSGVQDATAFQPYCLGTGVPLPSNTQSEDCLFINVWSPASAKPTSRLPVWIYIQGGGYTANANVNYNGSTIVATSNQNVVFVNFNYRVGSWGFLAGEKVRQNGDLNTGLLDQRSAFAWVRKYISNFGGDPNHVVIHGASAGAGSVALHLTAYGGRDDGLFVGAIGESVFFPTQPKLNELEWQFDRFVNASDCGDSLDKMSCLRSQKATILQAANIGSPYPGQIVSPMFYWTPTIDGDLIQDYPYRLLHEGRFVKVPIIFGDDTDEASYFVTNATSPKDIAVFFKQNYPLLNTHETDAIIAQYPLMPPLPAHAAFFPSLSAAYGESTFICPGNFISRTFATMNDPYKVWNYRYNVLQANNIDAGLGVPHLSETPAIFGVGNDPQSSYSSYNAAIIPLVMNYWISFVRHLSPNRHKYPSAPHWESFGDGKNGGKRIKLQTNVTAMELIPQDQVKRCEFWKGLADVMEQ